MLFTTPIFLFLFLPVIILFYAVVGKTRKRLCILVYSVVFHLLFNLNHPLNLLYLAVLIIYSFFAGMAAKKFRSLPTAFAAPPLPALSRRLICLSPDNFIYPIGITLSGFRRLVYYRIVQKFSEKDNRTVFILLPVASVSYYQIS